VKGETDKRMVVVALRGKRSKNTPSIQQEYTRKRTAAVAIGCTHITQPQKNHVGILTVSHPTEPGNPVSFP